MIPRVNSKGSTGSASSDSSLDSSALKKNSKRPTYSRFTQQELPACKPLLTPAIVVLTFASLGVIFVPAGLISLSASRNVVEIVDQYDIECILQNQRGDSLGFIQNSSVDKSCNRTLIVPKFMKSPIHIYYELDNFYQNHRRYVKSRSDKQLKSSKDERTTSTCAPEAITSSGLPIVPCGLISWSLFNDTYKFVSINGNLNVSTKNIAWGSDKNHKFGNDVFPKNFQSGPIIGGGKLDPNTSLSEQENLIVWMRIAALPNFRKLYGRIEEDLVANQRITVTIENNYNTYSFGGKKKLVLSTTSWIGGKKDFLGVAYLTVGGLSLLLSVVFMLLYVLKPRTPGDPAYLSWNRTAAGY